MKDLPGKDMNYGIGADIYSTLTFPDKRIPKIDFHIQGGYWGQSLGLPENPHLGFVLNLSTELTKGLDANIGLETGLSNFVKRTYSDPEYYYQRRTHNFPVKASLNISYTFGNRKLREIYTNTQDLKNSRF